MILVFSIDFSSKRVKLALRFFTYGVMTVTTVVISTVLVFFALGYRLDRNFNFTQGGLVQFRSFPEGADVTVNGKKENFKTPGKVNLPAGRHTATMSSQGYRSWSKSFSVDAGQLIWLNYARFIPETVVTDTVQKFPSLTASLPSPDRRWLLLQMTASAPDFTLVDFSDEQKPKLTSFQLPEAALTKKDGKLGTFQLVEWDLRSQYALVKHQNGDVREFLRVDRSKPDEAVNMTRIFGLNITEAHFSGNNANVVFANTDGILRRLDIGSKSASGALVNDLKQFIMYGEESVAFTSTPVTDSGSRQQIVGVRRGDKVVTVRSLPLDKQVIFAYSEYDDHEYLAVATADSSKVEVIRDPRTDGANDPSAVFAQFDLGKSTKWLSFSNNGRMLMAQNNSTFATYDLEEAKSYQFALDFGTEITNKLSWFDDFYLWSDTGGKLRIVEFDGKNDREITSVQPNFGVTLSSNGKRLFSVGKTAESQFVLQSSKMTLQD